MFPGIPLFFEMSQEIDKRSESEPECHPSSRSLHGLDWTYFFLADVLTGVGPFLAVYLASRHWNTEQVGIALTIGGLAGVVTQVPAGALVDRTRRKRLLVIGGLAALVAGSLMLALGPSSPQWSPLRYSWAAPALCSFLP